MRKLVLALVLPVLAATTVWTHDRVHERRAQFPRDQDVLYLPPSAQLVPMSLGYREALADLIWIRAVIFTGDKAGGANYAWIMQYLEAINTLAPGFRRPYAWGGVVVVYSGQAIERAMIDRAITLYRRGLELFPEDHELLFAIGMLLTRDVQMLPGYTPEEREAAKTEGALLIRRAAAFGAPPLVRQLAATLVADDATDQLAIQFLESQLLQAEDEGHRRLLQRKLEALIGEAGLESIQRLREEFEAERQAEFPYLAPDLYVLVREE
ncbi:hypothetical protein ACNOYE_24430 [Nannocystaceae bacterium ST9]